MSYRRGVTGCVADVLSVESRRGSARSALCPALMLQGPAGVPCNPRPSLLDPPPPTPVLLLLPFQLLRPLLQASCFIIMATMMRRHSTTCHVPAAGRVAPEHTRLPTPSCGQEAAG